MRQAFLIALAVLGSVGAVHVVRVGDVEVAVSTDQARYALGEPVQMQLTVQNRGFHPVTFEFATSQRYDFRVLRPDGRLVWQWSHDKVFAQVLGSLVLQPQETRVYSERWDQVDTEGRPVPPGRYVVEGVFAARTAPGWPSLVPRHPRVTIEIVRRPEQVFPLLPFRKVFVPGAVRVRFFPWATRDQIEGVLRDLGLRVTSVEADGRTYVVRTSWPHETDEKAKALNRADPVEWAVPHYLLVPRRP